jgi:putative transposase
MTKLRHFDNEGTARFVTFCCYRNLPFLQDDRAKRILIEEIEQARVKHGFRLFAYVIMPEHVHMVIHPPEGMRLGLVIGEIKSRSARRLLAQDRLLASEKTRVFWMRRCYDHNCRTLETTLEKIRYCHNNPVNRGLVTDPAVWIWSSFGCYHGATDVLLAVDLVEL